MGKRVTSRVRGPGGGVRTRRFVRVLPVVLIVGGLVLDAATPPAYTAVPLFAAAPLIAAPFFSRAGTIRTGAASLLAVIAVRVAHGTLFRVVPVVELLTVLTVSVLAVVINQVVRRSNEQLASARAIAETAMRAVLPTPADRIGGLHVAARYEAAQADEFVGGDLFAVADTPHGVRMVVGDVRGKGLDAVEAVAVVIGAFREVAEQERSLEGVAQRLERALAREGARRGGLDAFEGFITAVLAEIPPATAQLRIVNRGHPEPLLLHPDGALDVLRPSVPALPRHGPGRVAGPRRRVGPAGRDDAAPLHGRPVGGAERRGGLLRSRRPAAWTALSRSGGAVVRADGRRTAAHRRRDDRRHGAARRGATDGAAAGAAPDGADRGAERELTRRGMTVCGRPPPSVIEGHPPHNI